MVEVTDIKGRINKKSHELFLQYGIRSVSMDDIANAIGSSKKTIYLYYNDKETLVEEVVESLLAQSMSQCSNEGKISLNAIEEALMAIEATTELLSKVNPIVLYDLQKYHPKIYSKFISYKNQFLFGVIKQNLLRGIEEGYYRPDFDVDMAARFRISSILFPFGRDYFESTSLSLLETQQQLFLFFLYGIATPKGYKIINQFAQQRLK